MVTRNAFIQHRLTVFRIWALFAHKAAFRTIGHNHRIFHHLRFHQAQYLGAKIFHAIRPAQAASGHFGTAQMHAFNAWAVHPNLKHRPWLGQEIHFARLDFHAQHRFVAAFCVLLPEVGAHHRQNHRQYRVQNAVFISIADIVKLLLELFHQRIGLSLIGMLWVQTHLPQTAQAQHRGNIVLQTLLYIGLAKRQSRLFQILGQSAQQHRIAPRHTGFQYQGIEAIHFHLLVENLLQQSGKFVSDFFQLQALMVFRLQCQTDVAHRNKRAIRQLEFIRNFFVNGHAQALNHRQDFRQTWQFIAVIQTQTPWNVHIVARVQINARLIVGRAIPTLYVLPSLFWLVLVLVSLTQRIDAELGKALLRLIHIGQ